MKLELKMFINTTIGILLLTGSYYATAGPLEDLQPGHWAAISLNNIEDEDPCPANNCSYSGLDKAGVSATIDSWNGGAFAPNFGTKGGLIVYGGGHKSYDGNEIYIFSLDTLRWERYTEPARVSSGTKCVDGAYPDSNGGTPCAAHTYDYVDYHPKTNSFVVLSSSSNVDLGGYYSRTPFLLDLTTKKWRRGANRLSGGSMTGSSSAYDPNRDVFWLLRAYNQKFSKFDPNANSGAGQWSEYDTYNIDIDSVSAVDPIRDLFVTIDGRGTDTVKVKNLSDPSVKPVTINTTGDTSIQNSGKNGFEWDPDNEMFVAWRSGADIYTLKPPPVSQDWRTAAWVWTRISPAEGNNVVPTAANGNGTYSRFRYVPYLKGFILINRVSDPVYVYKMPTSSSSISITFTTSSNTINSGESVTLNWSAPGAYSCTASGDWTGSQVVTGSLVVDSINADSMYTLVCSDTQSSVTQSVNVTVANDNPDAGNTDQSIQVSQTNPAAYKWTSLLQGTDVYIDRGYTYDVVPPELQNILVLQTANSHKTGTSNNSVSFTVDQSVEVLIAHDDRILIKPIWLQSFTDTSKDIIIAGETHSLWKKTMPAGTVTMGGNGGTSVSSMYTVMLNTTDAQTGTVITPVAQADTATTNQNTAVTINVTANDSGLTDTPIVTTILADPNNGTATVLSSSEIRYSPTNNFSGQDTFTYEITDADGDSDTAIVTVTVTAPAPDTGNTKIQVSQTNPVAYKWTSLLQGTDIYIDRGYTYDVVPPELQNILVLQTANSHKTGTSNNFVSFIVDQPVEVLIAHDDRILTKPIWLQSFTDTSKDIIIAGETHSLWKKTMPAGTVTVGGNGGTSVSSMYIVMLNTTDAQTGTVTPVAQADSASTNQNTAVTINVTANDSGLTDTPIVTTILTGSNNGTATVLSSSEIRYSPTNNFSGQDTFTYKITDADGDSDTAVVTVTVTTPDNTAKPFANGDSSTTTIDTSVNIDVTNNDTGLADTPISTTILSNASNGVAEVQTTNNIIRYTPFADFVGTDSFVYLIKDTNGDMATATVTVSVTCARCAVNTTLRVNWNQNPDSDSILGYQVFYAASTNSADATTLVSTIPLSTSGFSAAAPSISYDAWTQFKLNKGNSVCFVIRAYNAVGASPASTGICKQIPQ